jgi:hypothetical protein
VADEVSNDAATAWKFIGGNNAGLWFYHQFSMSIAQRIRKMNRSIFHAAPTKFLPLWRSRRRSGPADGPEICTGVPPPTKSPLSSCFLSTSYCKQSDTVLSWWYYSIKYQPQLLYDSALQLLLVGVYVFDWDAERTSNLCNRRRGMLPSWGYIKSHAM